MASVGFEDEEWDEALLNELVQAEELALSSATQFQNPPSLPPPPPLPPQQHPAQPYVADMSYSPPRELSQRVVRDIPKGFDHSSARFSFDSFNLSIHGANDAKDEEIDRLKKELGKVSNQLSRLEQECLDLRKERDKKEDKLKCISSRIEGKSAEHGMGKMNLGTSVNIKADAQFLLERQNTNFSNEQGKSSANLGTSACKAVGVQTDNGEPANIPAKINLPSEDLCSRQLLSVWDSTNDLKGKTLVPKLLGSCEADFCVLFGCMNFSLPYKGKVKSSIDKAIVGLGDRLQFANSAETAKVAHLYSMFTKFSEDTVTLGDFVEALVDLCRLTNVSIIHRSLHILHMVLNYTFMPRRNFYRRDNVIVEVPPPGNIADGNELSVAGNMSYGNFKGASAWCCNLHRPDPLGTEVPLLKSMYDNSPAVLVFHISWISLFELMCEIVRTNKEQHVRLEAVSIMNIVLIRSNAFTERDKFGSEIVFQSISPLLKKEAGPCVRTQAVHLFYLLLNCPKVMATFYSIFELDLESANNPTDTNANSVSGCQGFSMIFEGLADCIACRGTGVKELKLRRNAIILLAFLASSGKFRFENLFSPTTHLLASILQGFTSDLDQERKNPSQPPEVFKERTLLMRETLILLNRLVSHPLYSGPVLRALTSRRDMASLTIDVANRLCVKGKFSRKDDLITKQIRESEILELARVFKKRVFAFLGESIS